MWIISRTVRWPIISLRFESLSVLEQLLPGGLDSNSSTSKLLALQKINIESFILIIVRVNHEFINLKITKSKLNYSCIFLFLLKLCLCYHSSNYVSNIGCLFSMYVFGFRAQIKFPSFNISNPCFQYTWSGFASSEYAISYSLYWLD